ncbi:carbohydrate kinase family protein [Caldimonas brevitalea]|uniref:Fructokinase n=1 Tax=Caldimonas brevitalea TaxID=413882 RepID=A0A0G3BGV9_9BURK|nr:carbohydrate kinase [Caldimonas brevitalea]AKJ28684.1 fructokinase [Caldimonas brevitalea]
MFVVCGEALMDVYSEQRTAAGLLLDARVGGSPFNVAVGLARLGREVAFLGGMSTDAFGERLLQALAEEGVSTSRVVRSDAPTTLSVVGLNAQGVPQYAFHGHGAADRQLMPGSLPSLPADTRVLQFGSYAMVVEPVGSTLRSLAARERQRCVVAYDPNVRLNVEPDIARWQAVVDDMLASTHLLKISDEDLGLLYPGASADQLASRWLAAGVRLVIVTRGAEGCQAWTRGDQVSEAAPRVEVVDTVGAGDTFQAALLTWLDEQGLLSPQGLDALTADQLRGALTFAGRAAAITCGRRGADLPRREEVTG